MYKLVINTPKKVDIGGGQKDNGTGNRARGEVLTAAQKEITYRCVSGEKLGRAAIVAKYPDVGFPGQGAKSARLRSKETIDMKSGSVPERSVGRPA